MPTLDALTFRDAIWLLPVVAALHVLEELPRFASWANATLTSKGRSVGYTRAKFVWENLILFAVLAVAVLLTTLLPAESRAGQVGLMLTLGAAAGLFFNLPFHAFFTLRTGVYSPGTVTACLFFLPVPALVFLKAASEGLLSPLVLAVAVALGIGLLPAVVALVHGLLDRRLKGK